MRRCGRRRASHCCWSQTPRRHRTIRLPHPVYVRSPEASVPLASDNGSSGQFRHHRTSGVTTPDQEETARPRLCELTLPQPETHRCGCHVEAFVGADSLGDVGAQPSHARPMLHDFVNQDDHRPEQHPGHRVLHDPHELVREVIESQVDPHPLQSADTEREARGPVVSTRVSPASLAPSVSSLGSSSRVRPSSIGRGAARRSRAFAPTIHKWRLGLLE
jgi:hypothetical protein